MTLPGVYCAEMLSGGAAASCDFAATVLTAAEVYQLHAAGSRQQEIGWLQIPVAYAPRVQFRNHLRYGTGVQVANS